MRKVDERLVVGGPSSAAAQWVESLLEHAEESGARLQVTDGRAELLPPQTFEVAADGTPTVAFALPQRGISYLELRAVG